MEILREQILDIFEIDEIKPELVLRELEFWDSLSVISLLAVIDESYGITIEATQLADIITIADLLDYVEHHRRK